jgi:hypothetical protein
VSDFTYTSDPALQKLIELLKNQEIVQAVKEKLAASGPAMTATIFSRQLAQALNEVVSDKGLQAEYSITVELVDAYLKSENRERDVFPEQQAQWARLRSNVAGHSITADFVEDVHTKHLDPYKAIKDFSDKFKGNVETKGFASSIGARGLNVDQSSERTFTYYDDNARFQGNRLAESIDSDGRFSRQLKLTSDSYATPQGYISRPATQDYYNLFADKERSGMGFRGSIFQVQEAGFMSGITQRTGSTELVTQRLSSVQVISAAYDKEEEASSPMNLYGSNDVSIYASEVLAERHKRPLKMMGIEMPGGSVHAKLGYWYKEGTAGDVNDVQSFFISSQNLTHTLSRSNTVEDMLLINRPSDEAGLSTFNSVAKELKIAADALISVARDQAQNNTAITSLSDISASRSFFRRFTDNITAAAGTEVNKENRTIFANQEIKGQFSRMFKEAAESKSNKLIITQQYFEQSLIGREGDFGSTLLSDSDVGYLQSLASRGGIKIGVTGSSMGGDSQGLFSLLDKFEAAKPGKLTGSQLKRYNLLKTLISGQPGQESAFTLMPSQYLHSKSMAMFSGSGRLLEYALGSANFSEKALVPASRQEPSDEFGLKTTDNIEVAGFFRTKNNSLSLLSKADQQRIKDNYFYGIGRYQEGKESEEEIDDPNGRLINRYGRDLRHRYQGAQVQQKGSAKFVKSAIEMIEGMGGKEYSAEGSSDALFRYKKEYILDSQSDSGYRLVGLKLNIAQPISSGKDYSISLTIGSEFKSIQTGRGGGYKTVESPMVYINKTQRFMTGAVFKNATDTTFHFMRYNELDGKIGLAALKPQESYEANSLDVLGGFLTTMQTSMNYEAKVRGIAYTYEALGADIMKKSAERVIAEKVTALYLYSSAGETPTETQIRTVLDARRQGLGALLSLVQKSGRLGDVLQNTQYDFSGNITKSDIIPNNWGDSSAVRRERRVGLQNIFKDVIRDANSANTQDLAKKLVNNFNAALQKSVGLLPDDIRDYTSGFTGQYNDIIMQIFAATPVGMQIYKDAVSAGYSESYSRQVDAYSQPHTENYSHGQSLHSKPVVGITPENMDLFRLVSPMLGANPDAVGGKVGGLILNPYPLSHGEQLGNSTGGQYLRTVSKSVGRAQVQPFTQQIGGLTKIQGGAPVVYNMLGVASSMPTLQAIDRQGYKERSAQVLSKMGLKDAEATNIVKSLESQTFDPVFGGKSKEEDEEAKEYDLLYYFPYAKTEQIMQRMKNLLSTRPMFDASREFIDYSYSLGLLGRYSNYQMEGGDKKDFLTSPSDLIGGRLLDSMPIQQFESIVARTEAKYTDKQREAATEYKKILSDPKASREQKIAAGRALQEIDQPIMLQLAKDNAIDVYAVGKGYMGSERPRLNILVAGATQLADYGIYNTSYRKDTYKYGMKLLKPHPVQTNITLSGGQIGPASLQSAVQKYLQPGTVFIARDTTIQHTQVIQAFNEQLKDALEVSVKEVGVTKGLEAVKFSVDTSSSLTRQSIRQSIVTALGSANIDNTEIDAIYKGAVAKLRGENQGIRVITDYKTGQVGYVLGRGAYQSGRQVGEVSSLNTTNVKIGDLDPGDAAFKMWGFMSYDGGHAQPLQIRVPAITGDELNSISVLGETTVIAMTGNTATIDTQFYNVEDFMSGMRAGSIIPKGPMKGGKRELFEAAVGLIGQESINLLPSTVKGPGETSIKAEDVYSMISPSQVKAFNFEIGLMMLADKQESGIYKRLTDADTGGVNVAMALSMLFLNSKADDIGGKDNLAMLYDRLSNTLSSEQRDGKSAYGKQYAAALRAKKSLLKLGQTDSTTAFTSFSSAPGSASLAMFSALAGFGKWTSDSESIESALLNQIITALGTDKKEAEAAQKRLSDAAKGLMDYAFAEKSRGGVIIEDFETKPLGLLSFLTKASADIYRDLDKEQLRKTRALGEVILSSKSLFTSPESLIVDVDGLDETYKKSRDSVLVALSNLFSVGESTSRRKQIQVEMQRRKAYLLAGEIHKISGGDIDAAQRILNPTLSVDEFLTRAGIAQQRRILPEGMKPRTGLESRFATVDLWSSMQSMYAKSGSEPSLKQLGVREFNPYLEAINQLVGKGQTQRSVLDDLIASTGSTATDSQKTLRSNFEDTLRKLVVRRSAMGPQLLEVQERLEKLGITDFSANSEFGKLLGSYQEGIVESIDTYEVSKVSTVDALMGFYSSTEAYAGLADETIQKAMLTQAQRMGYSLPSQKLIRSILDKISKSTQDSDITEGEYRALKEVELVFEGITAAIQQARTITLPMETNFSKISTPAGSKDSTALEGHLSRSMTERQLKQYTYALEEFADLTSVQNALMSLTKAYYGSIPNAKQRQSLISMDLSNINSWRWNDLERNKQGKLVRSQGEAKGQTQDAHSKQFLWDYLANYNSLYRNALPGEDSEVGFSRISIDNFINTGRAQTDVMSTMERINIIAYGPAGKSDDPAEELQRRATNSATFTFDELSEGISRKRTTDKLVKLASSGLDQYLAYIDSTDLPESDKKAVSEILAKERGLYKSQINYFVAESIKGKRSKDEILGDDIFRQGIDDAEVQRIKPFIPGDRGILGYFNFLEESLTPLKESESKTWLSTVLSGDSARANAKLRQDEIERLAAPGGNIHQKIQHAQAQDQGAAYLEGMKSIYKTLQGMPTGRKSVSTRGRRINALKRSIEKTQFISLYSYEIASTEGGLLRLQHRTNMRGEKYSETGLILGLDVLEKMSLLFQNSSHEALVAQQDLVTKLAAAKNIIDRVETGLVKGYLGEEVDVKATGVTQEEWQQLRDLQQAMMASKITAVSILQNENSIRQATGNRLNMMGSSFIAMNSFLVGATEVALGARFDSAAGVTTAGGYMRFMANVAPRTRDMDKYLLVDPDQRKFLIGHYKEEHDLQKQIAAAEEIGAADKVQALTNELRRWQDLLSMDPENQVTSLNEKLLSIDEQIARQKNTVEFKSLVDPASKRDAEERLNALQKKRGMISDTASAITKRVGSYVAPIQKTKISESQLSTFEELYGHLKTIEAHGESQATFGGSEDESKDKLLSMLSRLESLIAGAESDEGMDIASYRLFKSEDIFSYVGRGQNALKSIVSSVVDITSYEGSNSDQPLVTTKQRSDAVKQTTDNIIKEFSDIDLSIKQQSMGQDATKTARVSQVNKVAEAAKMKDLYSDLSKVKESKQYDRKTLSKVLQVLRYSGDQITDGGLTVTDSVISTIFSSFDRLNKGESLDIDTYRLFNLDGGDHRKAFDGFLGKILTMSEQGTFTADEANQLLDSEDKNHKKAFKDFLDKVLTKTKKDPSLAGDVYKLFEVEGEKYRNIYDQGVYNSFLSKLLTKAKKESFAADRAYQKLGKWHDLLSDYALAYAEGEGDSGKARTFTQAELLEAYESSGKSRTLIELELITGQTVTSQNRNEVMAKVDSHFLRSDILANRQGMPSYAAAGPRGVAAAISSLQGVTMEEMRKRGQLVNSLFTPDESADNTLMMISAFGFQFMGLGDYDGDSYQAALSSVTKAQSTIARTNEELTTLEERLNRLKKDRKQQEERRAIVKTSADTEERSRVNKRIEELNQQIRITEAKRRQVKDSNYRATRDLRDINREARETQSVKSGKAYKGLRSYVSSYLALPSYLFGDSVTGSDDTSIYEFGLQDDELAGTVKQYRDTISGYSDRSTDSTNSVGAFAWLKTAKGGAVAIDKSGKLDFDVDGIRKSRGSTASTMTINKMVAAAEQWNQALIKEKIHEKIAKNSALDEAKARQSVIEDIQKMSVDSYMKEVTEFQNRSEAIFMSMSTSGKIFTNVAGSQISPADLNSIQSIMGTTGGGLLGKVYNTVVPSAATQLTDSLMNRMMSNDSVRADFLRSVSNLQESASGYTSVSVLGNTLGKIAESLGSMTNVGGVPWELSMADKEAKASTAYRFMLTTQQYLRDAALKPKGKVGLVEMARKFRLSASAISQITDLGIQGIDEDVLSKTVGYDSLLKLQPQAAEEEVSRQFLDIISQDFLGAKAGEVLSYSYDKSKANTSADVDADMTAFAMLKLLTDYTGSRAMTASEMMEKGHYSASLKASRDELSSKLTTHSQQVTEYLESKKGTDNTRIEAAKQELRNVGVKPEMVDRVVKGQSNSWYIDDDAFVQNTIANLIGKFQSQFLGGNSVADDFKSVDPLSTERTLYTHGLEVEVDESGDSPTYKIVRREDSDKTIRRNAAYQMQDKVDAYNRKFNLSGQDALQVTDLVKTDDKGNFIDWDLETASSKIKERAKQEALRKLNKTLGLEHSAELQLSAEEATRLSSGDIGMAQADLRTRLDGVKGVSNLDRLATETESNAKSYLEILGNKQSESKAGKAALKQINEGRATEDAFTSVDQARAWSTKVLENENRLLADLNSINEAKSATQQELQTIESRRKRVQRVDSTVNQSADAFKSWQTTSDTIDAQVDSFEATMRQNMENRVSELTSNRDAIETEAEGRNMSVDEVAATTFRTLQEITTRNQADDLMDVLVKTKKLNQAVQGVVTEGQSEQFAAVKDSLISANNLTSLTLLESMEILGGEVTAHAQGIDSAKLNQASLAQAMSTGLTNVLEAVRTYSDSLSDGSQFDNKLGGAIMSFLSMGGVLPDEISQIVNQNVAQQVGTTKDYVEQMQTEQGRTALANKLAKYGGSDLDITTAEGQVEAANRIVRGQTDELQTGVLKNLMRAGVIDAIASGSGFTGHMSKWSDLMQDTIELGNMDPANLSESQQSILDTARQMPTPEYQWGQRLEASQEMVDRFNSGLEKRGVKQRINANQLSRLANSDNTMTVLEELGLNKDTKVATQLGAQLEEFRSEQRTESVLQTPDTVRNPGVAPSMSTPAVEDLSGGNTGLGSSRPQDMQMLSIDKEQEMVRQTLADVHRTRHVREKEAEQSKAESALRRNYGFTEALSILAIPALFAAMQGDIPVTEQVGGLVQDVVTSTLTSGTFEQSATSLMLADGKSEEERAARLAQVRRASDNLQTARMRDYFRYYDSPTEALARGVLNETIYQGMGRIAAGAGTAMDVVRGHGLDKHGNAIVGEALTVGDSSLSRIITEVGAGLLGRVVGGVLSGRPVNHGFYSATEDDFANELVSAAASAAAQVVNYVGDTMEDLWEGDPGEVSLDDGNHVSMIDTDTGEALTFTVANPDKINVASALDEDEYLQIIHGDQGAVSTYEELA